MTKTNKRLSRPNCYGDGGFFNNFGMDDDQKKQYAQTAGIVSSLGSGIIDATAHRNDFGNTSTGAMMGSSALRGATVGSQFGPVGTAIGALAGAGLGLFQGSKLRREEADARTAMQRNTLMNQNNYSAALIGANPELVNGIKGAGAYATGGNLKAPLMSAVMNGGAATPLSSDSVDLSGQSHAEGGIQLPQLGAEVEGGETAKGSYVFSKELGFAKLHRPIAKAIGIIEQKPQTPERKEALKLLEARENRLMQSQETFKQLHAIS